MFFLILCVFFLIPLEYTSLKSLRVKVFDNENNYHFLNACNVKDHVQYICF